jgi:hypothetical protein
VSPVHQKNALAHCWPTIVLSPPGLYIAISISQNVGHLILQCMLQVIQCLAALCNPAVFSVANCGLIAGAAKTQFSDSYRGIYISWSRRYMSEERTN